MFKVNFIVAERTETVEQGLKLILRSVNAKGQVDFNSNLYLDAKQHPDVRELAVGDSYTLTIEPTEFMAAPAAADAEAIENIENAGALA